MNAAQMVAMVQQLRDLLPGGESLPDDWNSLKCFVCGLGNVYELIDQCRECGFIFFNILDDTVQILEQCPNPECGASRYVVDELGRVVSSPCYLRVNFSFQLAALFRKPEFSNSLVQQPLPPHKYTTSPLESPSFAAAMAAVASPDFDFIVFVTQPADGGQLHRAVGAQHNAATPSSHQQLTGCSVAGAKPCSVGFVLYEIMNTTSLMWEGKPHLLCGALTFFPPKKPVSMDKFLDAHLQEMNELFARGVMVFDASTSRYVRVRVVIYCGLYDGQWLADAKNCIGPTGKCGCHLCNFMALSLATPDRGSFRCWKGDFVGHLPPNDPARLGDARSEPDKKTHAWCLAKQADIQRMESKGATKGEMTAFKQITGVSRILSPKLLVAHLSFLLRAGIVGPSSFQRNLVYSNVLALEGRGFPVDLAHMYGHIADIFFERPDAEATIYTSSCGFIQLRYKDALDSIAKRLHGLQLPSRFDQKIIDILGKPHEKSYCKTAEFIAFCKSGLPEIALIGNIPEKDLTPSLCCYAAWSCTTAA